MAHNQMTIKITRLVVEWKQRFEHDMIRKLFWFLTESGRGFLKFYIDQLGVSYQFCANSFDIIKIAHVVRNNRLMRPQSRRMAQSIFVAENRMQDAY